ncbi:hypothetical protein CIHG_01235 [Coccidioides immitis H538.4]|uniref:Uncharacterized protein n=2 Tax=Coccidioides immitis TaxID=5501 RepID=A0A0J8U8Q3_COCIT|nr:hypothetical protein CIRG_01084 [Coccidioides immitis RMSCC 2394]KMU83453.1 hypothetical protein CIHG_01235 [Coccidioides immitis H538.4]
MDFIRDSTHVWKLRGTRPFSWELNEFLAGSSPVRILCSENIRLFNCGGSEIVSGRLRIRIIQLKGLDKECPKSSLERLRGGAEGKREFQVDRRWPGGTEFAKTPGL